jgi:hypothetical protein
MIRVPASDMNTLAPVEAPAPAGGLEPASNTGTVVSVRGSVLDPSRVVRNPGND